MAWIKTVDLSSAGNKLRTLYERVAGPNSQIDNILQVHSLRPHTLVGHMTLYKNVLHHAENELPKWYLESIGVYVSMLNKCDYCVEHHKAGLDRLVGHHRGNVLAEALARHRWPTVEVEQVEFEERGEQKFAAGLPYAKKLTLAPHSVQQVDALNLREQGFSDGEVLELNQVIAYFNYANRTVLGLGVEIAGETLGLSPSDEADEENWGHQT